MPFNSNRDFIHCFEILFEFFFRFSFNYVKFNVKIRPKFI